MIDPEIHIPEMITQINHITDDMVAGAPTAGSKITPHKLRATYATDMLIATNNLSLVQKALNHESPRTTTIYADYRTIELEKARNTLLAKNKHKK